MAIERLFRDRKYKDVVPESVLRAEYRNAIKEGEINSNTTFSNYLQECCSWRKGFLDYIGEGTETLPSIN